jgi:hypothetical protein
LGVDRRFEHRGDRQTGEQEQAEKTEYSEGTVLSAILFQCLLLDQDLLPSLFLPQLVANSYKNIWPRALAKNWGLTHDIRAYARAPW